MKYFVAYHNEQKTGIPCTQLPYPRVHTRKKVTALEGSVVWVIAGVGRSPKSYYIVSNFTIERCEPEKYPGDELPNEVSGTGKLFGLTVNIDNTQLLEDLKRQTANFVSGFCETNNSVIVSSLKSMA